MSTETTSGTPALDKQRAVIEDGRAETVQAFIDWLGSHNYAIVERCRREHEVGRYCSSCSGTDFSGPVFDFNRLMADHFGIDLTAVEQERRALLASLAEVSR